jgi:transcriptional regulator with XRE-family HTH domain
MSTLGQKIKSLRLEKKLTQEELGNILGLGKSSISMYENDKMSPDDDIKNKIADYFNVSIDYLLGRTDIRNPYIPQEYQENNKVTKRDLKNYEEFIKHAGTFFMDDQIDEEDKQRLFDDISEIFWESKLINKKKYGKKNKKKED